MSALLIDPRTRGKYDESRDRIIHNFDTPPTRTPARHGSRRAPAKTKTEKERIASRFLRGDLIRVIVKEERVSYSTIYKIVNEREIAFRRKIRNA